MKPSKAIMEHIDYQLRLMEGEEKTIGEKLSALDFQIAHEALKVSDMGGASSIKSEFTEQVFEFVEE